MKDPYYVYLSLSLVSSRNAAVEDLHNLLHQFREFTSENTFIADAGFEWLVGILFLLFKQTENKHLLRFLKKLMSSIHSVYLLMKVSFRKVRLFIVSKFPWTICIFILKGDVLYRRRL